mmetsp:Transcript_6243/g.10112  ORF Transcript_6243/g.10112 Transcript_6243/m.10112 type:complete len:205 (+) Transcript_6243:360-974(+)
MASMGASAGSERSQATRCTSVAEEASACTSRKVSRRMLHTVQGAVARTEAERGALYSRLSSPTESPALSSRTRLPSMTTSSLPVCTMYILSPASPCRMRWSPGGTRSQRIVSSTASTRSPTASSMKKNVRSAATRYPRSRSRCCAFSAELSFSIDAVPFFTSIPLEKICCRRSWPPLPSLKSIDPCLSSLEEYFCCVFDEAGTV